VAQKRARSEQALMLHQTYAKDISRGRYLYYIDRQYSGPIELDLAAPTTLSK